MVDPCGISCNSAKMLGLWAPELENQPQVLGAISGISITAGESTKPYSLNSSWTFLGMSRSRAVNP